MDINSFATLLRDLDSSVLIDRFGALVRCDHRVSAGMLCYIAEIDRRKLWAERGYSSMFKFLVEGFHMSEQRAGKRIQASRAMQSFPLVGEMVARGELHMTGVSMLAAHLTDENHREVLARARHRSAREIERLVAEIHPRPAKASFVRREPRRGPSPGRSEPASTGSLFAGGRKPPEGGAQREPDTASVQATDADPAPALPAPPARVKPTAPRRYRVGMTIVEATHDKLGEARALLSHRVPSGDVAVIFDLALDALLEKARKDRTAATSHPRPTKTADDATRTRHVPADVRRAVWKRDGGRCAYVSPERHRCTETHWLELHHVQPYARGGRHTVEGIELRCRPHNQYEADRDYGPLFMDRKRRASQAREALARYARCA